MQTPIDDGELILAAEEFSEAERQKYHAFSSYEERILRSLIAHGPLLLRGGRGSGKSALMLEADRRMEHTGGAPFSAYVSLRYMPLLRTSGSEYIGLVTELITQRIAEKLRKAGRDDALAVLQSGESSLHGKLVQVARLLEKRIVLLIDDAAHIGREASLGDFFDLFRTISSDLVCCKTAIYPGVTKFGNRFDIYNDSTVVDIARNESAHDYGAFFLDVIERRFAGLSTNFFQAGREPTAVPAFIGRVVLGNMRAFVFACKNLAERCTITGTKIGLVDVTECLKYLASDYYWPLLDELAPKLGAYEPQINTARQIAEILFSDAGKDSSAAMTIHREHVQRLSKAFEILEYSGFVSKRDASKLIVKGGGRGPRYALNLANLLEHTVGRQVTNELFERWLSNSAVGEVPFAHPAMEAIQTPKADVTGDIDILDMAVGKLKKSKAYPYGLTEHLLSLLSSASVITVNDIAEKTDEQIDDIPGIGEKYVKRIRDVVNQAIWM